MSDTIIHTGYSRMDRSTADMLVDDGDANFMQSYIRLMTRAQRALMALHGDGPVPIVAGESDTKRVRDELVAKKLLYTKPSHCPSQSFATRQGRRVIGAVLAQQAETLAASEIP